MLLNKLLADIDVLKIYGDIDIDISGLKTNSKEVIKNSLFICITGFNHDANNYISEAIKKGATAIISEKELKIKNVTTIKVSNIRKTMSALAYNFYGKVSDKIDFIFVVGTNGKSTTSYLIHEFLKHEGINSALVGTMYIEYMNEKHKSTLTTPDPINLHELLQKFYQNNVQWVVMEVSAHAIDLFKTYCIIPKIQILTNVSQDHLDYFKNYERYRDCKKNFFLNNVNSIFVINSDDSVGLEIIEKSKNKVVSYGINTPADVFCMDIKLEDIKTKYIIDIFDHIYEIESNLFGEFNIYNTMAALICAYYCGLNIEKLVNYLKVISPPPGRFNVFFIKKVMFVVDFAHTPDGIYSILKETKKISNGKIITVFGCGGDRDILKRPIMGRIASSMSDRVILTSDNPRTEDPMSIIEDILEGVKYRNNILVKVNRKDAIKEAFRIAKAKDVVLILGKGAENYIDINNKKIAYSDLQEVIKLDS